MRANQIKTMCISIATFLAIIHSVVIKAQDTIPSKEETIKFMRLANDYWIDTHTNPGDAHWVKATYQPGNMACYFTTQDQKYYDYSYTWAEQNDWHIYTLRYQNISAVNHCCGQTYIELYQIDPDPVKIENITEIMDMMCSRSSNVPQNCVDETFMSGPVYAKLTALYDDPKYENKYFSGFTYVKDNRGFYDTDAHLWYRDGQYKYPGYKTPNGLKCFWSRGNGWAIGAFARILDVLPENNRHYDAYLTVFKEMMAALKPIQRSDGFWNMSLVDPDDYGGPETSGTAFFAFGLGWGINKGVLERNEYLPVLLKAWHGLTTIALQDNGKLGYVQSVGQEPVPGVTADKTEHYGVGAFLLAGREMVKLSENTRIKKDLLSRTHPNATLTAKVQGDICAITYTLPSREKTGMISLHTMNGKLIYAVPVSKPNSTILLSDKQVDFQNSICIATLRITSNRVAASRIIAMR